MKDDILKRLMTNEATNDEKKQFGEAAMEIAGQMGMGLPVELIDIDLDGLCVYAKIKMENNNVIEIYPEELRE